MINQAPYNNRSQTQTSVSDKSSRVCASEKGDARTRKPGAGRQSIQECDQCNNNPHSYLHFAGGIWGSEGIEWLRGMRGVTYTCYHLNSTAKCGGEAEKSRVSQSTTPTKSPNHRCSVFCAFYWRSRPAGGSRDHKLQLNAATDINQMTGADSAGDYRI